MKTFARRSPLGFSGLKHNYSTRKAKFRLLAEITKITVTAGLILTTLMGVLYAERLLLRAAEDNQASSAAASNPNISSTKSIQEDLELLRDDPVGAVGLFIYSLDESTLLELLEGLSLVTAIVLFLLYGREEQARQERYLAWWMLDTAHDKETSYARYHLLQDLNGQEFSLQGLDAEGADLMEINLQEADLHECTLVRAKLRRANFSCSQVDFSNLDHADLRLANLQSCRFLGSSFEEADLGGADLTSADLSQANLRNANLTFSNFLNTNLFEADLTGANFCRARNLQPEQIKCSRNWQHASFDEEFLQQLKHSV